MDLGIYYYEKKEYDLAKKYFIQAVEEGNIDCYYNLATYYYLIEQNYKLAKKYYHLAVDNKNDDGMNSLANYYERIELNLDLAEDYYLMAIEYGNLDAIFNIANLYYNCEEYELAKEYFLKLPNDADVLNKLGIYYYEIEEDYTKAIDCFLKSKTGSAYYNLAIYYDNLDLNKTIYYYLQAINLGNVDAMNNLGVIYYELHQYKNAYNYLKMAENSGDIDVLNNLGVYYFNKKDYKQSLNYLTRAMKSGNSCVMRNLAYYHRNIDKKRKLAARYEVMAEDKDNPGFIDKVSLVMSLFEIKD